jgi:diaminopimelate epimerase
MPLEFHKMHGAGNDFVLLDLRQQDFELDAHRATGMANRRTGIGCDQVLVLRSPRQEHCIVEVEIWNADGSRAEQCGNGMRCIGLYLQRNGEVTTAPFCIRGPVSTIELQALGDGCFRVNMGVPEFAPDRIPIELEPVSGYYELEAASRLLQLGAVSMGNPHAVMVVEDLDSAPVNELGAAISRHPAFPRGCNAGFASIVNRNTIGLRVFERGAGETQACGSGACAAVAVLISQEKMDKEVVVNQMGGTLMIEWPALDKPVMMTGPAEYSFTGMVS